MVDWDELVRREGPAAWRTIYRLVRNRADADECLQEAFVAAVEFTRRQEVHDWPALLKRLAVTRGIDRLRLRLRRGESKESVEIDSLATDDLNPHERVVAEELAAALSAALPRLPARQAEAFCLHELEGLSLQEIADGMSLRAGAVGALVHRARRKLQRQLRQAFKSHIG